MRPADTPTTIHTHRITPLRLPNGGRELFALCIPPRGDVARPGGVVLCNPLGQEAIRTHRLFRVLGDRLSASGLTVLRFDYFATGDSAGDDGQGELDGWVRDTMVACEWMSRQPGCSELTLFGMRLGSNIALRAAACMAQPPSALLLWDPIPDGALYLQQMTRAHEAALARSFGARWATDQELRRRQLPAPGTEFLGQPLNPALRRGLENLHLTGDLAALPAHAPVPHVWSAAPLPSAGGASLHQHRLELEIDWMTDQALDTPIAPIEIVRSIVATAIESRA